MKLVVCCLPHIHILPCTDIIGRMQLADFNYVLPPEVIAKYPPRVRGATRLLTLNRSTGQINHERYQDLAVLLHPGDVVVLNDTKVIKARLVAIGPHNKEYELLLLESHGLPASPNMQQVLYRGKLAVGDRLLLKGARLTVHDIVGNGIAVIKSTANLVDLADRYGHVPLPPYLKRPATRQDIRRYQTPFATKAGSVAAPTASLNFTNRLKNTLQNKGIIVVSLTLHIGIGTFLPIRVNNLEEHTMHSEYFEIPVSTVTAIQNAKAHNHKVVAIGTTVCRTLEYAANEILRQKSSPITGEANIFIYPGYTFKITDALLTNFHAPKSTVLMMAAAFARWDYLKTAYNAAIKQGYRFLSYGDSMFIY